MVRKVFRVIVVVIMLQCFCSLVFAENIVTNEISNTMTNEAMQNQTLEEQREEVEKNLKEANVKLDYVQSELSATMLTIQKLEDKVLEYKDDLEEMQVQMDTLQASVEDETAKLNLAQQDYTEKYELLKQRIVAMYEAGETRYLDVLLSSRNIVEFISGFYLIQELAEYDNNLIEEVGKQKASIEETKTTLENAENDLRQVKAKKEQTTLLWQNTKKLQEEYIAKLNDKEKKLQKEISEYKQEQFRIESLITQALNNGKNLNIQYTGGEMLWPVAIAGTCITSEYGAREHPIEGVVKEHTGIDIGNADYGTPVVAAADGVVTYAGWLAGYGNCVIINHGEGITTLYGHGQSVETSLHKEVKKGELILKVGSTGNSTGPHLHFEVRYNGICTNPLQFVKAP